MASETDSSKTGKMGPDTIVQLSVDELKNIVKMSVLEAFSEDCVLDKLEHVIKPLIEPYKEAVKTANAKIDSLDKKVASQQITITRLSHEVEDLKIKNDDLEQHGRKGSARIFGVPENTKGSTDDKVLKVINDMIGIVPPITLDDLEVTHRVGRTVNPTVADQPLGVSADGTHDAGGGSEGNRGDDDGQGDVATDRTKQTPRPILVKFSNRRTKSKIMENRKNLKDKAFVDANGHKFRIYIQDDLTRRRANLAYLARQLKNSQQISDTWIAYGKVQIKDNHGHIKTINSQEDISKLEK